MRGIQAAITSLREGVQATLEVEGEQYRCAIRGADGAPLATGAPLASPAEVDVQLAELQHWVATVERFRIEEPPQAKGTTRPAETDPAAGVYDLERASRTQAPGLELVDLPGEKIFSAQINDERGEPLVYLPRFANRFVRDEQVEALLAISGDKRRYDGREAEGRLYFAVTARNGRELARSKWFAAAGERMAAIAWLTLVAAEEGRKFAAGKAQREAGAGQEEGGAARPAGFEGFRGGDGQHYFRLNGEDGEEVLTSHGYGSAKARDNGIRSLLKAATDPGCYRVAADGTSFVILALNGRQLARSRSFAGRDETDGVIAWIRREVIRFGRACGIRLWESMIIEIPHEGEDASEPPPPSLVDEVVSRPLRALRVEGATEMAAAPAVLPESDGARAEVEVAGDSAEVKEPAGGETPVSAGARRAVGVAAVLGDESVASGSATAAGEVASCASDAAPADDAAAAVRDDETVGDAPEVVATTAAARDVAVSEESGAAGEAEAARDVAVSAGPEAAATTADDGAEDARSGAATELAGEGPEATASGAGEATASEGPKPSTRDASEVATEAASAASDAATATEVARGARDVATTTAEASVASEIAAVIDALTEAPDDDAPTPDTSGVASDGGRMRDSARADRRGESGAVVEVGGSAREGGESEVAGARAGSDAAAGTGAPEPEHPVARVKPEQTLPAFVPPVATERQAGQASTATNQEAVPQAKTSRATERLATSVPQPAATRATETAVPQAGASRATERLVTPVPPPGATRPATPQAGATRATETAAPQAGSARATERLVTPVPQAGATRPSVERPATPVPRAPVAGAGAPATQRPAPAVRPPSATLPAQAIAGAPPVPAPVPPKPSVRGWTMLVEGVDDTAAAVPAPAPAPEKPKVPAPGKPSVRGWTMLMEGGDEAEATAPAPSPAPAKPAVLAPGKPSVRGWTMLMEDGGEPAASESAPEKPVVPAPGKPSVRGWTMLMDDGGEAAPPATIPAKPVPQVSPQPTARGWTKLPEGGDDDLDLALSRLGDEPTQTPERPLLPIGEAAPPASAPAPRRSEEPSLLDLAREPVQANPGPSSRPIVPTMAPLVLEKSGPQPRAVDKPKTLIDLVDLPVPDMRESQANPVTRRQLPTLMPEDAQAGAVPPPPPSLPATSSVPVPPEPVQRPSRGLDRRMVGGIFLVIAALIAIYIARGRESGGRGDAGEGQSKRQERVAPPESEPPAAAEAAKPTSTARVTSTPVPTGCPPEGANDPAIGIAVAPSWPVAGEPLQIVAATLADEQPVALRIFGAEDQPVGDEVEVVARGGVPTSARATWTPNAAGVYRIAVAAGARRACLEVQVETKRERRVASVGPTGAWPVERAWTAGEEALYSAWIRELFSAPEGAASFARLDAVTGDPARNFLHDALGLAEDGRGLLRLTGAGDDLPYMLRAYWAWKRRLPFAYRSCSDKRGEPPQCGALHTNLAVGRKFSSRGGELGRIQRFFQRELPAGVSAGNARTANGDPRSDLYPVRIDRRGLRPGTLYVDPRGTIFIVVELVDRRDEVSGMVQVVDGQPGGAIVRRRFWEGSAVWHPEPALGGTGFKRFRPVAVESGAVVQRDDGAIADAPSHADLWAGHAELDAQDFYDAVTGAVDPPPRDPARVQQEAVAALLELVQERVDAVERGAAYVRKQRKPLAMPAGLALFAARGAWDEHATPGRDLRLLAAIDAVKALPVRVRARPDLFAFAGDAEAVAALLEHSLTDTLARHRFSYRRSDGSRQELSLADVVARSAALERAYNPNDCPELRWGAEAGSDEAATCSFQAPQAQQAQMERQREWFRARRPLFGRSP